MLRLSLMLLLVSTADATSAQIPRLPPSQTITPASARADGYLRTQLYSRSDMEECLIRKTDRKRVCHTRAEWNAVANRLAAVQR